jgi:apolipoprotein N-acyltransferase
MHYLTLVYWLYYTMQTYGHLPWYLSIPVLFLMATYLALYIIAFATLATRLHTKPAVCLFLIPALWVSLEYIRSFLFTGFPWELMGYTQYRALHIIQISDMFGVCIAHHTDFRYVWRVRDIIFDFAGQRRNLSGLSIFHREQSAHDPGY